MHTPENPPRLLGEQLAAFLNTWGSLTFTEADSVRPVKPALPHAVHFLEMLRVDTDQAMRIASLKTPATFQTDEDFFRRNAEILKARRTAHTRIIGMASLVASAIEAAGLEPNVLFTTSDAYSPTISNSGWIVTAWHNQGYQPVVLKRDTYEIMQLPEMDEPPWDGIVRVPDSNYPVLGQPPYQNGFAKRVLSGIIVPEDEWSLNAGIEEGLAALCNRSSIAANLVASTVLDMLASQP